MLPAQGALRDAISWKAAPTYTASSSTVNNIQAHTLAAVKQVEWATSLSPTLQRPQQIPTQILKKEQPPLTETEGKKSLERIHNP